MDRDTVVRSTKKIAGRPFGALGACLLAALVMAAGDCGQDQDGDGYTPAQGDCNDADPAIHPGASEVCNGLDDDCDDAVDEGFDQDGDGFAVCENSGVPADCDDGNPEVHPGAAEQCNGLDDDCDGDRDEGLETFQVLLDGDGDGFGAWDSVCAVPEGLETDCAGDCDDYDPGVHPGAEDLPDDGFDQDCGGAPGPQPHVGLGPGSFDTIQAALDAGEDGDIVWVGPGTYVAFNVRFGGKAVTLAGACGAERTLVDGQGQGTVFVFDQGEGSGTVLSGFTLTGGRAAGGYGGGLFAEESSPVLQDLVIRGNEARYGGGAALVFSSALLRNCAFLENQAMDDGVGSGGGLFANRSDLLLSGCRFANNAAAQWGGGADHVEGRLEIRDTLFEENEVAGEAGRGGGLHASLSDSVVVSGGTFRANDAGPTGLGGGAMLEASYVTMEHTVVEDNRALQGGGIYLGGGNATIAGSSIAGNRVGHADPGGDNRDGEGAGLFLHSTNLVLTGGSITDNVAQGEYSRGGGLRLVASSVGVEGTHISDNEARGYNGLGGGLYLENASLTAEHLLLEWNVAAGEWTAFGGAIAAFGSDVRVTSSILAENGALAESGSGGGAYLEESMLVMTNSVLAHNRVSSVPTFVAGGIELDGWVDGSMIVNTIFYYDEYYNLLVTPQEDFVILHTCLHNGDSVMNHNMTSLDVSNTTADPGFLEASPPWSPSDYHLALSSSLVDQGQPDLLDVDGSPSDIGCYGGPGGAGWDRDEDGVPDYFWPGTIDDAPDGFDPADFDPDDQDPLVPATGP